MKNAAITLTFASLLLTGTPVLAANPIEPSGPDSDKSPGVTPNDARMPLPGFGPYYAPYHVRTFAKWTGASDSYTPNPHRNTPGAEAKD
jgi:hypothetical protein